MATLTIRMPDERYELVKKMIGEQGLTVNKFYDELTIRILMEWEAYRHLKERQTRGNPERGLALLDRLDQIAE